MSVSKLKIALITTVVGFAGFSSPAYAQITVEDRDANALLEQIRDQDKEEYKDVKGFRDKEITDHYKSQIEHYDREIARLNATITSLGYYSVNDKDAPQEKEGLKTPFEKLKPTKAARTAVQDATEGKSSEFGIMIDGFQATLSEGGGIGGAIGGLTGGGGGPGARAFRKEYGLAAPEKLYPENEQLAKGVQRMYSSLYFAQTVAGEANKGRKERLKAYDDLLELAQDSKDLQTALRVQNAILLENGRNLALLIDLQTASLNAESMSVNQAASASNGTESMFGAGSGSVLGDAALLALVEAVN